jgi:hypothetical protein
VVGVVGDDTDVGEAIIGHCAGILVIDRRIVRASADLWQINGRRLRQSAYGTAGAGPSSLPPSALRTIIAPRYLRLNARSCPLL